MPAYLRPYLNKKVSSVLFATIQSLHLVFLMKMSKEKQLRFVTFVCTEENLEQLLVLLLTLT
jgi:hypothetical protein